MESDIENHVAARIRLRRGLLGMSQSDLARKLGITFQQVQKYERGSNRVSVGKLFRLSEILNVPLTFFFDGLEGKDGPRPMLGNLTDEPPAILSRRELDLLRAWRGSAPDVADSVASLLRALVSGDAAPEDGAAEPVAKVEPPADEPAEVEAVEAKETEEEANIRRRRRRGASWDPADIARAVGNKRKG